MRTFSQQEAKEMYSILTQIYESLRDQGGIAPMKKLNVGELAWLVGIGAFLEKIEKSTETGK